MEIDDIDSLLYEYRNFNIKPNAKSHTESWSDNNPAYGYKDSGSTTVTGVNLGREENAILKTLKDKGSSSWID